MSPKVGVNFAPLLGDQTLFQVLSLGYAPDFVSYNDASSENYNAHRLAATVKGKADDFPKSPPWATSAPLRSNGTSRRSRGR